MRASLIAEKAGVPSVTIVETGFMRQAQAIAESLGVSRLPIAEYPGQIATDSPEAFREKMRKAVLPSVIEGLASPIEAADRAGEPSPRDIVYVGTLDEVDEFFYQNLWTDGLPIVPPTIQEGGAFSGVH